jgi:hypothetical protein
MSASKVKSIEKTQKASEPSSPTRALARQLTVGVSQSGFGAAMFPQMAGNLALLFLHLVKQESENQWAITSLH